MMQHADNNSVSDRRMVLWALLPIVPIVSAVTGFTLAAWGRLTSSHTLVTYGLYATIPAALAAMTVIVSALALLSYRLYASVRGPEEVESETDPRDLYISADEIVPRAKGDQELCAIPLEQAPDVPRTIRYSAMRNARWFKHLHELCMLPPEQRVLAEFVNVACFRLGFPHDDNAWSANKPWFREHVPEMLSDRDLDALVLDLGGVAEPMQSQTLRFLIFLEQWQSGMESLRLCNPPRGVISELERYDVRVQVVDTHWVDEHRVENETYAVCQPGRS